MNTSSRAQALESFLEFAFPEDEDVRCIQVCAVAPDMVTLRLKFQSRFLRPGQTIAGPTLMKVADTAAYLCLVHQNTDMVASVTSNLHMDFLKRAPASDLIVEARCLKLGRTLSTVAVSILCDDTLLVHATVTYALNPNVVVPTEIYAVLQQ